MPITPVPEGVALRWAFARYYGLVQFTARSLTQSNMAIAHAAAGRAPAGGGGGALVAGDGEDDEEAAQGVPMAQGSAVRGVPLAVGRRV